MRQLLGGGRATTQTDLLYAEAQTNLFYSCSQQNQLCLDDRRSNHYHICAPIMTWNGPFDTQPENSTELSKCETRSTTNKCTGSQCGTHLQLTSNQ